MHFISILILSISCQAFAFDGAFKASLKKSNKCLFQKPDIAICEGIEINLSSEESYTFTLKNLKGAYIDGWNELSRKIDLIPLFKNETAKYSAYVSKILNQPELKAQRNASLCLDEISFGCRLGVLVSKREGPMIFTITDAETKY
jgi:hypothetical protein